MVKCCIEKSLEFIFSLKKNHISIGHYTDFFNPVSKYQQKIIYEMAQKYDILYISSLYKKNVTINYASHVKKMLEIICFDENVFILEHVDELNKITKNILSYTLTKIVIYKKSNISENNYLIIPNNTKNVDIGNVNYSYFEYKSNKNILKQFVSDGITKEDIHDDIYKYIIQYNLYPSKEKVFKKINDVINKKNQRILQVEINNIGKSSNVVFKIITNKQTYYAKIYIMNKFICVDQARAYRFLNKYMDSNINVVHCKTYNNFGLLITTKADGISVRELLKSGEELYKRGQQIGMYLKKLHSILDTDNNNQYIPERTLLSIIRKKVNDTMYRDFVLDPGKLGYMHGDLHINNIFISDNNISFIDCSAISKYKNRGLPSFDYINFITSIHHINERDNLSIEHKNISIFIEGFKCGYGFYEHNQVIDYIFANKYNNNNYNLEMIK